MAKQMGAAEFKQKCLSVLDQLESEGVIITKHGKPVAQLIPVAAGPLELLGCLAGKLKVKGDIISTGVEWDAES